MKKLWNRAINFDVHGWSPLAAALVCIPTLGLAAAATWLIWNRFTPTLQVALTVLVVACAVKAIKAHI